VLEKIFGPKRDEVTGEWLTLHNVELYCLYVPNIVRVIKFGRINWVWNVARVWGEEICLQSFGEETSEKEATWTT